MNYLIAVFADRSQAETAFTTLEKGGLSLNQVAILGRGYQSADEYGLINPGTQARRRSTLMAYWLVPFGFISGVTFNLLTSISILGNPLADQIFGGILGAASGAFGSFIVGGGVGLTTGSGDALPYRNRLDAGKYLVIVRGQSTDVTQATQLLRPLNPENIQGYTEAQ